MDEIDGSLSVFDPKDIGNDRYVILSIDSDDPKALSECHFIGSDSEDTVDLRCIVVAGLVNQPVRLSKTIPGLVNQHRAEFTRWQNEHALRPSDNAASLLRTPFTTEIMAQPYPLDLRIPSNKEYDGRTDLEVHINTYYGNMLMMDVSDAVMCRAFYSTLSGRAAEWFKTLDPGSISCFANLAMKFNRKFVTSKIIRKPYMYLEKAKQLEGETLTDFLVKWKAAVGEVEPMDDLTAIHMLHISLRAGYLYQNFILHPPTTYEEALRRVTDYANAGEANAVKRSQEVGSSRKPPGRLDNRSAEHIRSRTRPDDFTALNRSAAEALQYAQSCNLIRLPRPGQEGKDKSKHCAYHRCAGHDTEECTTLRQLLEDLLQAGKLDKCVGKWEESKRSTEEETIGDACRAREPCPVAIVESREIGKRQKMEPITFALEDQPETGDTGMEALVVTIDIMGVDVQRVMVDTGSNVNVLYLDVFEKLKLDRRALTPVGAPLSGFTGDTIHPEGKITLLVEFGTPPKSVKTQMEFVVVNFRCVHIAILGRPTIMRVGGIISMPHLCMKFPTSAGVGVLRGDTQSAMKCYSRAVNRQDSGSSGVNTIIKEVERDRKEQLEPFEEIEEVSLSKDRPERKVKIGRALTPELRLKVMAIL
ncbi:PREDICTED: uncharacterized protein LOC109183198 [Ipomoea nil]|uniref:uncharacterized protein LOC109183198 n=1 Tax=Ipomoea nil TaxID=35883 RepID=UPI000901E541|nr:PREDICTED: uncharacterized protein LOC109183198 [Ipomoea nil]